MTAPHRHTAMHIGKLNWEIILCNSSVSHFVYPAPHQTSQNIWRIFTRSVSRASKHRYRHKTLQLSSYDLLCPPLCLPVLYFTLFRQYCRNVQIHVVLISPQKTVITMGKSVASYPGAAPGPKHWEDFQPDNPPVLCSMSEQTTVDNILIWFSGYCSYVKGAYRNYPPQEHWFCWFGFKVFSSPLLKQSRNEDGVSLAGNNLQESRSSPHRLYSEYEQRWM